MSEHNKTISSVRRYASIKKARKEWLCSTCGRQIKPGDSYEYSYAHGGFDVQNKCSECLTDEMRSGACVLCGLPREEHCDESDCAGIFRL